MRRHALTAFAFALPVILTTAACWPGIPIAALAAAAGGGGGGGGNDKNVVEVEGSIVTDPSGFATSKGSDHEFNDRLGMAFDVGPVSTAAPGHVAGNAATTATIHALVDDASGRSIIGRELLSTGGTSFDARFGSGRTALTPVAVARIDRELFILDVGADGAAAQVRVTPLESNYVKRRFELPHSIAPAGFAALADALLVLDVGNGTTRLLALDAADAAPLFATDLGRAGLVHLAGAEELTTGAPRLFTSVNDEVFEIHIERSGSDQRFTGLAPAFAPEDLVGGIAALGYDGVLVHVVDGAGTLHSYDTTGRTIATRAFVAAGTQVHALVAHLDLGFDGFHFEVAAGERLSVDIAVPEADGATLFAFALPRTDLELEKAGRPDFFTQLAAGVRHAEIDNTAGATPVEYDLAVGARKGAGRYAVALGDGRPYGIPEPPPPARDDDATKLGDWLEREVFATLPVARLVAIYRDPLLPDFDPGFVVFGRSDAAVALDVAAPRGFALSRTSRSPSGFEVWSHVADTNWRGPAVATLHGMSPRASSRREESRKTLALLARMAGAPGVKWREPVIRAHALTGPVLPNDPQFQAQKWAFDEMHVRDAWNTTTGDANTVLAIVDTGIRTDNADLVVNDSGTGYDLISNATSAGDGDGIDPNPFDNGTFNSNSQHGSHCAGTIGTGGNNLTGLCGINWDCKLMAVRALGTDGSGSTTDIAEAIRYAAKLSNASGATPPTAAAVINLSLGTPFNSNTIRSAIQAAAGQGCVICCAAGNDGNGTAVLFPAANPESIAVAACDFNKVISSYSNTGPELDVTGPGGANTFLDQNSDGWVDEIWSTIGNDQIAALAGTSMACSEVSGVCGLVKSVDPTINQTQMLQLLAGTAQDLRTTGFDDFSGWGLVNALDAVIGATPVLTLSAHEVDLGETGSHTLVQAQNTGGGVLSLGTLTPSAIMGGTTTWLQITPASDGKTIALDADRTGLVDGDYQVQVDVVTNGGNDSFLVDLTANSARLMPQDVGTVTIQLFAEDGVTLVTSTTATAANGYAFHLPKVPVGKYFLRAGTDLNGNGVLGEPGELFGAYPRGAAPQVLELDKLNDFKVDFVVK